MPLNVIAVRVVRLVSTVTATFGLGPPAENELPGSPFLARVYRTAQTTVQRDDAAPGTATLDEMQRLSVLDPACPIQVNDIAFLPRADGTYTRAKIVRPRFYSDRCQYDLETGAEGTALTENLPMLSSAEQQALQAQIDSLNQQNQSFAQQLGDVMTALKNIPATQIDQVDAQVITGAATTSGSPLPVPAAGRNIETYKRTLTANLTDYAYATSAPARKLTQAFTNDAASGAFIWTITAQSGDTFNGPDLTAATSFTLANGETRTFTNTAPGVWDEV